MAAPLPRINTGTSGGDRGWVGGRVSIYTKGEMHGALPRAGSWANESSWGMTSAQVRSWWHLLSDQEERSR